MDTFQRNKRESGRKSRFTVFYYEKYNRNNDSLIGGYSLDNNPKEPQYGFSPITQSYVPPQAKTSGKAIASLVLGIISLITLPLGGILFLGIIGFFSGIVAIVFASLSFKEIKRVQVRGRGMAIAGLVCGIVATALNVLAFVVSFIIGFTSAINNV